VLGRSYASNLPSGDEDLAAVPSIGRASRVEGAVAPEADVTRALYEEYANQVFRYCLHQLGSREEAEDAVQSTFLNAFRGIKRGVVPEVEAAWLFKIAHNVCLSRRRSSWRRGRIESPADFEVIEELTPAPTHRADELIGLQEVLERLPETQRRAILLREWQGLSYREIAAELELSQGAVETLIFRARRSLASGLEQPLEPKRRRVARALDWGNVLAGLKAALVSGSVAAKVAATVAVVSATTVVAAEPLQHQQHHHVASVPKVHPAVPASAQVSAQVPQAPATLVSLPPATAVPLGHTQKSVSHSSSGVAHSAALQREGRIYSRLSLRPSSKPAAQSPKAEKQHTQQGKRLHVRRKHTRTTAAVRPAKTKQAVSGKSDQTVPTTGASTQASNGRGAEGNGKSKDSGGDGVAPSPPQ
jgi:RNA polymerase sigma factor (sigma-70 family)